ncbi:HAD hydrolase family protein [Bacillus spongiae]|uniref:HAD hydrolase family protein n=1 Tax=Bacillus spongiae TaxID=2683610 RepID=UPI003AF4AFD7
MIEAIMGKGILVSYNGATTLKTDNKSILHEFSYDIQEVAPIIKYCRKHDFHFSICTALDFYTKRMDVYQTELYKKFNLVPKIHKDILSITDR